MNEGFNLHKSVFSDAALSLHFCNTFSSFEWWKLQLTVICLYAIRCNYVQHKLLFGERENGEL